MLARRRTPSTVVVATAVFALAMASSPRVGQTQRGPDRAARNDRGARMTASDSSKLRRDDGVTIRLPAVRSTGAPGSIVVVKVPVPESVRERLAAGERNAFYSVRAEGAGRLLAAASGPLQSSREALALSFSLSKRATAGTTSLAMVEFRVRDVVTEVPIEFEVPRVAQVDLQFADAEVPAQLGRWTVLRARVLNRGNAEERVSLTALPPTGWRVDDSPEVRIAAGTLAEAVLRVWVPPTAGRGLLLLRVVARRNQQVVAEGSVRLLVNGASRMADAGGLTLQLTSMSVGADLPAPGSATGVSQPGAGSISNQGYAVALGGNLSDSVHLDLRGNVSSGTNALGNFVLSKSGIVTMPPSLSVSGPRAGLSAGILQADVRDPGGAGLSGMGGSAFGQVGRWRLSSFGGLPFARTSALRVSGGDGLLAGSSVERRGVRGLVGLQTVHLEDRQAQQGLQSVTVYGSDLSVGAGRLDFSLAARRLAIPGAGFTSSLVEASPLSALPVRFDGEVRPGASMSYVVSTPSTQFDIRGLYAPGTTQYFARSGSELSSNFTRRLAKSLALHANGWTQGDQQPTFGQIRSSGWMTGPSLETFGSRLHLSLEARGAQFTARNNDITFENHDRVGGGSFDVHAGVFYLRGRASLGITDRLVGTAASRGVSTRGARQEALGSVGVRTSRGSIEVAYNRSLLGMSGAIVAPQELLVLRTDNIRLFGIGAQSVTLSLEAQQLRAGAMFPSRLSGNSRLTVPLGGGLSLVAGVDYNPFLTTASTGGTPRLYSLRVDHQSRLGAPFGSARSGNRRVFLDANGNGDADRGEEGIAGIVVRCGDALITSGSGGRLSCPQRYAAEVDVRSLPIGLVATQSGQARDVALRRVEPVAVRLRLPESDALRLPSRELAKAFVSARDAAGTRWFARSTEGSEFVFDALPLGRYSIDVEQGEMPEPIFLADAPPELWITGASEKSTVEVPITGRRTRIRVIGPTSQSTTVAPVAAPTRVAPQPLPLSQPAARGRSQERSQQRSQERSQESRSQQRIDSPIEHPE